MAATRAEAEALGTFHSWAAFSAGERAKRICFVHGAPAKSEGRYSTRGASYVQVTHRPAEKIRNEVSVTAGYVYRQGSSVEIEIDGTKFALFTTGDSAWARDAKTDEALVKAMGAGRTMIVRGTSSRGTETTDSYSLAGFTAARNAAAKACGFA
ncbi:MAG: hypothetical protein FJX53_10525 [Alphaproteobacteria bacterium]|nr:hypothetical protein [Alphaproteobacteria bacterium]